METIDNHSALNYVKNVIGIKASESYESVPTYISICRIRNSANTLSLTDTDKIVGVTFFGKRTIASFNECKVSDITDAMILSHRIAQIRDEIWFRKRINERLPKAIELLDKGMSIEAINHLLNGK